MGLGLWLWLRFRRLLFAAESGSGARGNHDRGAGEEGRRITGGLSGGLGGSGRGALGGGGVSLSLGGGSLLRPFLGSGIARDSGFSVSLSLSGGGLGVTLSLGGGGGSLLLGVGRSGGLLRLGSLPSSGLLGTSGVSLSLGGGVLLRLDSVSGGLFRGGGGSLLRLGLSLGGGSSLLFRSIGGSGSLLRLGSHTGSGLLGTSGVSLSLGGGVLLRLDSVGGGLFRGGGGSLLRLDSVGGGLGSSGSLLVNFRGGSLRGFRRGRGFHSLRRGFRRGFDRRRLDHHDLTRFDVLLLESLHVIGVRIRHGSAGVAQNSGSGGRTGNRVHRALVLILVHIRGALGLLLGRDTDRSTRAARGATDAAARLKGEESARDRARSVVLIDVSYARARETSGHQSVSD